VHGTRCTALPARYVVIAIPTPSSGTDQQSYDDKREDEESECLMELVEEEFHEQMADWNANQINSSVIPRISIWPRTT
jgi:hypothetical protein